MKPAPYFQGDRQEIPLAQAFHGREAPKFVFRGQARVLVAIP